MTEITDWWPTVERFLQAAGIQPASWHETVPEQIERAIERIEDMRAESDILKTALTDIRITGTGKYAATIAYKALVKAAEAAKEE